MAAPPVEEIRNSKKMKRRMRLVEFLRRRAGFDDDKSIGQVIMDKRALRG